MRPALLVAVLALTEACSFVTVQRPRFEGVKTVAVIGYGADVDLTNGQQRGTMTIGDVVNTMSAVGELAGGTLGDRLTKRAEEAYETLATQLEHGLGWKVVTRGELLRNPTYTSLAQKHGPFPALNIRELWVPGMMSDDAASRLDPVERDELRAALGVDALVFAHVEYRVGSSAGIAGLGPLVKYLVATTELHAWDAIATEEVWKDTRAVGETTRRGVTSLAGAESSVEVEDAMREAEATSYARLVARCLEAK